jgi:hypothetical protein
MNINIFCTVHKYTWSASKKFVTPNNVMPHILDSGVFRGSEISSNHILIFANISLPAKWRRFKELNLYSMGPSIHTTD